MRSVVLGMLLALLSVQQVLALGDPATKNLEQIRQYNNVAVTGDMLLVVHYDMAYTVAPAESISQGWIGRVLDVGGSGQRASVAPESRPLIPHAGYDHGLYSFYFEVAPVITGTLTITLEGNPSLSPTPDGITSTTIETRQASDLVGDIRGLAIHLGHEWGVDVITFTGGKGRLTVDGENYFTAAIPNLRIYAPSVFELGVVNPDPAGNVDSNVDHSFEQSRRAVWDGSPIRTVLDNAAPVFGMSTEVLEVVLILLGAGAIGLFIHRKFPNAQELGILLAVLWIVVASYAGFGVWAMVWVMTFVGVAAIGYLIFFRNASA